MLEQVVLETATPLTLNVTAVDPNEILIIKSISGLTSPGNDLYMGEFAGEGGYYQGRRAKKLNPVFNLKMNPDHAGNVSISAIREILYRQFYTPTPGKAGVQFRLVDDELPDRYLIGYCEGIDTDQWVKEQSAAVSLVCNDSFMRSAVETTGAEPAGWTTLPHIYDGSAYTGLEMTLKVLVATPTVTLDLNGSKMVLQKASGNFAVNDIIVINSQAGSRKITLNGVDVMALLTGTSVWATLDRDDNLFRIYGSVIGDGKAAMTAYHYRSAWWGS